MLFPSFISKFENFCFNMFLKRHSKNIIFKTFDFENPKNLIVALVHDSLEFTCALKYRVGRDIFAPAFYIFKPMSSKGLVKLVRGYTRQLRLKPEERLPFFQDIPFRLEGKLENITLNAHGGPGYLSYEMPNKEFLYYFSRASGKGLSLVKQKLDYFKQVATSGKGILPTLATLKFMMKGQIKFLPLSQMAQEADVVTLNGCQTIPFAEKQQFSRWQDFCKDNGYRLRFSTTLTNWTYGFLGQVKPEKDLLFRSGTGGNFIEIGADGHLKQIMNKGDVDTLYRFPGEHNPTLPKCDPFFEKLEKELELFHAPILNHTFHPVQHNGKVFLPLQNKWISETQYKSQLHFYQALQKRGLDI